MARFPRTGFYLFIIVALGALSMRKDAQALGIAEKSGSPGCGLVECMRFGGGYALPTLDNGVFALLLQIFANGNSAAQQAEQHARDDVDAIQGKDIGPDIHYGKEGARLMTTFTRLS